MTLFRIHRRGGYHRPPLSFMAKRSGDPVVLAGKFQNKLLVSFAMIVVAISTLATNIAANIVSPANDFANPAPRKINFPHGRIHHRHHRHPDLSWKLIADPNGYIFTWLIAYSQFAGAGGRAS